MALFFADLAIGAEPGPLANLGISQNPPESWPLSAPSFGACSRGGSARDRGCLFADANPMDSLVARFSKYDTLFWDLIDNATNHTEHQFKIRLAF